MSSTNSFHAAAAPRGGRLALAAHALARPRARERVAADQALPDLLLRAAACLPLGLACVRTTVGACVMAVGVCAGMILQTAQLFINHVHQHRLAGRQPSERHRPPGVSRKKIEIFWIRTVRPREGGAWAAYIGRIPPFFKDFRHAATNEAAKWPTSGAAFQPQLQKIGEIHREPANYRWPRLLTLHASALQIASGGEDAVRDRPREPQSPYYLFPHGAPSNLPAQRHRRCAVGTAPVAGDWRPR